MHVHVVHHVHTPPVQPRGTLLHLCVAGAAVAASRPTQQVHGELASTQASEPLAQPGDLLHQLRPAGCRRAPLPRPQPHDRVAAALLEAGL